MQSLTRASFFERSIQVVGDYSHRGGAQRMPHQFDPEFAGLALDAEQQVVVLWR